MRITPRSAGYCPAMAKETDSTEQAEPTKEELLEEARALEVEGRSNMNKDELAGAVAAAKGEPPAPGRGMTSAAVEAERQSLENAVANAQGG